MHSSRPVGPLVVSHADFLRKLSRTSSEKRRSRLLREASTEQVLAIAEIALNVLKEKFPLTPKQRQRLQPHADAVRKLSRARKEATARHVIQVGGGPMLASLITPVLVELGRALLNGS